MLNPLSDYVFMFPWRFIISPTKAGLRSAFAEYAIDGERVVTACHVHECEARCVAAVVFAIVAYEQSGEYLHLKQNCN